MRGGKFPPNPLLNLGINLYALYIYKMPGKGKQKKNNTGKIKVKKVLSKAGRERKKKMMAN